MKVLVFDIWGDMGHFKKFYTTSSPLSFAFPPPTTIRGMLGAILGVDKDNYMEFFSKERCLISLKIMAPIKKMRMGLNHINTKDNFWTPVKHGSHEARTQIRTEFIKDPYYRLYVSHFDNEVFNTLAEYVSSHKSVFTLSLGLSELLADFRFNGIYDTEEVENSEVEIATVIPFYRMAEKGIKFEEGKKYFKERMPIDMDKERVVWHYQDVLYEPEGKVISICMKKYWLTERGEAIAFF